MSDDATVEAIRIMNRTGRQFVFYLHALRATPGGDSSRCVPSRRLVYRTVTSLLEESHRKDGMVVREGFKLRARTLYEGQL